MIVKPYFLTSPGEAASALEAAEFAALMNKLAPTARHLGVAVSGGPDSMALAFCAKGWADAEGKKISAFIVDHALRPESAAEAENTTKTLSAFGISSEILRWDHAATVARLHESARKARYRLLTDACKRRGITELLFAHHRDDQAETILMRLAKGTGTDGLAGMAAEKRIMDLRILRPFLTIARERLAATCVATHLPFVTDPSNEAQKFARGRLRRVMPLLESEGLSVERLLDLGARAADAKAALDHAANILLRVAVEQDESGSLHIEREHFRSAPREIVVRGLIACLHSIQAADYAPEYASLVRLTEALRSDTPMPGSTLHGCILAATGTHATIMREYAAITDAPSIAAGETVMWDQRWRVSLAAGNQKVFVIRPLGHPSHERLDRLAPDLRRRFPQGRARACLPSLWRDDQLTLIPDFFGPTKGDAAAALTSLWPPVGR